MLHATCVQCGAEFAYEPSPRGPRRKLCFSPKCRRRWASREAARRKSERRAQEGTPIGYRDCIECGGVFVVNMLTAARGKQLCSKKCKWRRDGRRQPREIRLAADRRYKKRHPEKFKFEWTEERKASWRRREALRRGVDAEKFTDFEIFERDHWRCQLCKRKVDRRKRFPDPLSASLDHVVPFSRGGAHVRSNVQLAHLVCNLRKSDGAIALGEQLRLIG